MEIVQLGASDYDEWLSFLNEVFGRTNGKPMDFEKELPKMCVRDEEHMCKHIGVREEGKLRAIVGIYPLPAHICGIPVLFSTVGNVATHWEWEGRGYMSRLLDCAMDKLGSMGADASRLSGYRQRYNRYGYENCGTVYHMTLTERNSQALCPLSEEKFAFSKIDQGDLQSLAFADSLYQKNGIAVVRNAATDYRDVYSSLTAWRHEPYLVTRLDGTAIGYLSVSAEQNNLAEVGAVDVDILCKILCQWQRRVNMDIQFQVAPWQTEALQKLGAVCEQMYIEAPNLFKICNWVKVTDALLKLKMSYTELPDGELIVEIEGHGNICLYVRGQEAGCVSTNRSAALKMNELTAARFLFGPMPVASVVKAHDWASAVLPLPLSWNLQDRV